MERGGDSFSVELKCGQLASTAHITTQIVRAEQQCTQELLNIHQGRSQALGKCGGRSLLGRGRIRGQLQSVGETNSSSMEEYTAAVSWERLLAVEH